MQRKLHTTELIAADKHRNTYYRARSHRQIGYFQHNLWCSPSDDNNWFMSIDCSRLINITHLHPNESGMHCHGIKRLEVSAFIKWPWTIWINKLILRRYKTPRLVIREL